MSTYEDNLLTAQFAALAPGPLPGDWDDVLTRSGTYKQRRRAFVVLVAAVVVAVAAASALAVRAYLDKGFVGLPPQGAAPSTPQKGTLVLSYIGRPRSLTHALGRPLHRVWVYADGRLIWDREGTTDASGNFARSRYRPFHANKHTSGLLEQRLTPRGVGLLRSEATSTGLFDRSLALTSGMDWLWGYIRVRNGDRLVLVEWYHLNPGDPPYPARFRDPTEKQVKALDRLTARLASPGSWLSAGAWADPEDQGLRPLPVCGLPPFRGRAALPRPRTATGSGEGPASYQTAGRVRRLLSRVDRGGSCCRQGPRRCTA